MYTMDTQKFEELLDEAVLTWDIDITIKEIILPFLEKVQILSYNSSENETHLAVTAVRRKLIMGIERSNPLVRVPKTALLFLNEGEHYDLILLYLSYVLKTQGWNVIYLGTNISLKNLEQIVRTKKPDVLYTYIPQKKQVNLRGVMKIINEQSPRPMLYTIGCEHGSVLNHNEVMQYMHLSEVHQINAVP
jgi:hypothetical protein